MLDSLSPQRRRVVLVTAALAGLLVVALIATSVVRGMARSVDPVPQDQPGPVLLVPGYGGRVASLDPLAAALRAAGRDVVVVERLGDGTGDLRAEAEHLRDVAERTRADRNVPSVDVIGYSAGGVVARLWVRDYGGAEVARRVLTLGSPHHGTSQAALGRDWPAVARPPATTRPRQRPAPAPQRRRRNAGRTSLGDRTFHRRPSRHSGRLCRAGRGRQHPGAGCLPRVDRRPRRAPRRSSDPPP